MSCVVAIKENDKIYMGGDSFLGTSYLKMRNTEDPKVFIKDKGPYQNDFVYGVTGSMRFTQIIKNVFEEPWQHDDIPLEKYIFSL